jgi:hypothetical protein
MPIRELNLENTLQTFVSQLEELYDQALVSVTLYGSAAGADYNPDRSDLNFLILLQQASPAELKKSLRHIKTWQQRRIATPLMLDLELLEASLALFPMEFLEMKDQHETLFGQDPLTKREIPLQQLKLQCAQELQGKRLRLHTTYLETQNQLPALEAMLIAAVKSFGVMMRTLLRLKAIQPAREFLEILNQVEETFQLELDGFRQAHQLRMGLQQLDTGEAEKLFSHFVQDVNALVLKADAVLRE